MRRALVRPEHDTALLAFIKCHLTSFARWNILRVLTEAPDYCWSASEVARRAHQPGDVTRRALDDLVTEGLIHRGEEPSGPTYTVDGAEPTGRVLIRLLAEAGRNHGLRQIIVARILEHGEGTASPRRGAHELLTTRQGGIR
jgi:hypothetical protein